MVVFCGCIVRKGVATIMSDSLITKKVIAKSLKNKLNEKDFLKITVSDIMNDCQIRRQTFYDHFQDKYELLEWIFKQEITEIIEDNLTYERWDRIVLRIFEYFEDNQKFYQKALAFDGQNSFKEVFADYVYDLLVVSYGQIQKLKDDTVYPEMNPFELTFYTKGFVEVSVEWLLGGCQQGSHEISSQLIQIFNKILE